MKTAIKENRISLDFISNIKFTEFCVLVFNFLRNILSLVEDDFFKIEISLREVINNAIIHGNKSDIGKRVYVDFFWSKTRIKIRIKDENPEKVDFSAIEKKMEKNDLLASSGRGLLIMRSYMDRVEFSSTDSGSEVIMEKKL